jgi:hypothetical protein
MTQGKMPLQPLLAEGSKEIQRLLHSFNLLQSHINQQKNSLNESAEKLRLSARVFESSCESIVIADASMQDRLGQSRLHRNDRLCRRRSGGAFAACWATSRATRNSPP